VLAIDYGERKCGFASTDALRLSLEALKPLRHEGREEHLFAHIAGLLAERDVATLLVGVPLQAEGGSGQRARVTREFARRLQERFPALEVREWDERWTTKEAETRLRDLGRRGRGAREARDSWSALVLLEDWLRSVGPRAPGDGAPR
jgi:putative Holliday junction resolvase